MNLYVDTEYKFSLSNALLILLVIMIFLYLLLYLSKYFCIDNYLNINYFL